MSNNFLKYVVNTALLTLVLLFSACERASVDHDGLSALYLEVDDELVDSLMRQMDIRQKIGQLLIWNGTPTDAIYPFLPDYLKSNQLAGYQIEGADRNEFVACQDTCIKSSYWPPLIMHKEPLFLQNNFKDTEHFPSTMQLMATSGFEGFSSFWDFSASCASNLGYNVVQTSPLEHYQPGVSDSMSNLLARNEEELLRNNISELNTWRQAQSLTFVGPIGKNIYNPQDTLLRKKYPWRTLYSLVQNGLDGLVIESSIFMDSDMEVIYPDFLTQFLLENFEYQGLKMSQVNNSIELARAYLSGVELITTSMNPEQAFQTLQELVNTSIVAKGMLNEKVRKVIKARIWSEDNKTFDKNEALATLENFDSKTFEELQTKITEESSAVVYNRSSFLPIVEANRRFRIVDIGSKVSSVFGSTVEFYVDAGSKFFEWDGKSIKGELNADLLNGRPLIVLLNNVNLRSNIDSSFLFNLKRILAENKSVLVNIGNPYNVELLDTLATSVIQTFASDRDSQQKLAEVIFGGRSAKGQFPIDIDTSLAMVKSFDIHVNRLRKGTPKEVGLDHTILKRIDLLARKAIREGAFPGCQVAIVRKGVLVYEKSFGHLDSAALETVKWNHLYDVASVSKVAGTALVAMKEYEKETFKLNDRLSKYLKMGRKSRVGRVRMKDLLTHRSGIQPNMPIVPIVYPKSLRPASNIYSNPQKGGLYQIQVANNFYFNINSRDSVWQRVEALKTKRTKYRYSDVNFMLLQRVFERKTQLSLDQYLVKHFYKDLGLRRTAYKPLGKFKRSEIAPSAHDRKWRMQELRGYVHDEAAALEGGVGGNAGLFANARDLAVIGQMLLNKGTYGGKRYLKEETIELFTKSGHGNHRGLAFDKKSSKRKGGVSRKISSSSYGHTGFTGTLFWVDPKHDLIFVFNTNRIHPKVNNRQLYKGKYRQKMHDVVYRAMEKEEDQRVIPLRVSFTE